MALGGLRDLSLITTAPPGAWRSRPSIEWHAPTLREAALRELRRGGQIYFVHNEVRTIEKIAGELQRWCPKPTCASATGRCASATLSS